MKKIVCVLIVMVLASATFAAVDRIWTNGSGDQDFNRGSNWFDVLDGYVFTGDDRAKIDMSGSDAAILSSDATRNSLYLGFTSGATGELLITGGTNQFYAVTFAGAADSTGILTISGGDTTSLNYLTIGNTGYGQLTMTDGVLTVNRSQICQNVGSSGEITISGGEFNITRYLNVGSKGLGIVNVSGGTINIIGEQLRLGDGDLTGVGILNLSGTGTVNVLGNYSTIGEEGYGEANISGGTLNFDRAAIGYINDPNSKGYIYLSGGEINCNEYFTIGANGTAGVEITGGKLNTNRTTIAQGVLGETLTTTGYLKISGGELNVVASIELGREGVATLIVEGDAGKISCARFSFDDEATVQLLLNGSAGIGNGVCAFAGTEMDGAEVLINNGDFLVKEGAQVDASFITGTDVAGDYLVAASTERMEYLPASEPDENLALPIAPGDVSAVILSSASQTAGWAANVYDAGSGSALILSSPIAASEVAWASAGANDVAVVDNDSVALSSSKTTNGAVVGNAATGSLAVGTGANASFVNLTVGADAGSTGSVTMTDGSVDVGSVAFVGKEGAATLDVSGGSLSALNMIAATGTEATADITVSGDASFDITNMLALTAGAKFTVSGYQTTVNVANLALDKGANITFEIDSTNGAGNGIMVGNNVILNGTVSVNMIGERVDGTYTLIRALGDIFANDTGLVDSAFVSYEIVPNGDYQELQVTFFTPETCADVIDNGFGLAADMNKDCKVNIEDISVLANQWLTCNDPTIPECDWLAAN